MRHSGFVGMVSRLLLLLCLSGFVTPARSRAADDASALLGQVAARYQSLIDYRAQIDVRITAREVPGEHSIAPQRLRIVLAAARPRMYYAHQRSLHEAYAIVLATDGGSVLGHEPRRHLYVQHTAAEPSAERDALRVLHRRFFGRFELVDAVRADAAVRGRKRFRGQECVVVQLKSNDPVWTEELWIDLRRSLVAKSIFREYRGTLARQQWKTEATWRYEQLDTPLPPQTFTVTPPEDARRTNALSLP